MNRSVLGVMSKSWIGTQNKWSAGEWSVPGRTRRSQPSCRITGPRTMTHAHTCTHHHHPRAHKLATQHPRSHDHALGNHPDARPQSPAWPAGADTSRVQPAQEIFLPVSMLLGAWTAFTLAVVRVKRASKVALATRRGQEGQLRVETNAIHRVGVGAEDNRRVDREPATILCAAGETKVSPKRKHRASSPSRPGP